MKLYFPVLAVILLLQSCSDNHIVTGKDLMPEMLQTDSLQIIYFKSTDEPRYFTYASTNDPVFIRALTNDVTAETQAENPCKKEGKIYCYRKGEVFNTIFFAYLDGGCTFFRYIKNGNLYYFNMSDQVKKGLSGYKSTAIEPKANE